VIAQELPGQSEPLKYTMAEALAFISDEAVERAKVNGPPPDEEIVYGLGALLATAEIHKTECPECLSGGPACEEMQAALHLCENLKVLAADLERRNAS
jgi:hypothetical protein